ncbi:protein of unknown function (plasmid) [Cupriavidus neocaledonicus]|uniref:Uncharacterized protein n=1 Tax=Cupriavidus neocaledonicus TaxID=1040979 RepID=A0A375HQ46_9BURK|nr:exported hypothetical protein [Cupriavidus neocaledonicus]SPD58974.1 protein of unknown function [Cupriavidus neocaledonicus]
MSFVVVVAALAVLMLAACGGYSFILFAPMAALGGVALLDPSRSRPLSPASSWRRWSAS